MLAAATVTVDVWSHLECLAVALRGDELSMRYRRPPPASISWPTSPSLSESEPPRAVRPSALVLTPTLATAHAWCVPDLVIEMVARRVGVLSDESTRRLRWS